MASSSEPGTIVTRARTSVFSFKASSDKKANFLNIYFLQEKVGQPGTIVTRPRASVFS